MGGSLVSVGGPSTVDFGKFDVGVLGDIRSLLFVSPVRLTEMF